MTRRAIRILVSANKDCKKSAVRPRSLLFAAVLLLSANGCGTTNSTAPGSTGGPSSAPEVQAANILYGQLLDARQDLESEYFSSPDLRDCFTPPFEALAPTDLNGYQAGPVEIIGMGPRGEIGQGAPSEYGLGPMGAAAIVRLVDPDSSGRWIEFRQGRECWGVFRGAPPDAVDVVQAHPVDIPGVDLVTAAPQINSWSEPNQAIIELRWSGSEGTSYQLTGRNVTEQDVIGMASSLSPVCCAPPAPTSTVEAPVGIVGQPLAVTWYDGTGTVTIDKVTWDPTDVWGGYGAWLILDVTYRASSGIVAFDWMEWSSRGSTGGNTGAFPPPDASAKVEIPAGQQLTTQIRFPSWQASTRIDLSEGSRRIATWSVSG